MTKKQKIVDAAIELFAKKGIEQTTIQQITAYCGISKGAFYLSFPSKDALILEIIDRFMKAITSNIDQLVIAADVENKLYVYFEATFTSLAHYTEFARILLTENFSLTGEEILHKVMYYEQLADALLEKLFRERYGAQVEPLVYELVVLVKSFVKSYVMLLFTPGQQVDIEKLSESLVEKTDILAKYSTKVYLTQPMTGMKEQHVTIESIYAELIHVEQLQKSTLMQDTVQILREELARDKPRLALLTGMLANLAQEEHAGWLCYMLRQYIQQQMLQSV